MPESWRVGFEKTASDFILDFVRSNPGCTIDFEPISQGWTNYVARGYYHDHLVVYKYYSNPERWNNELFCLKHFSQTGIVPEVYEAVDDRLTVMSLIPGTMPREVGIDESVLADRKCLSNLSHQIGQAVGKLVATPLPTDAEGRFPPPGFVPLPWYSWNTNLREAIVFYVELGRKIQSEVSAYRDPIFSQSLTALEYESTAVEEERKILFHNDFGNLHVDNDELQGIFDLENCRLGAESMQLSKGFAACEQYGLIRDAFLEGYAEVTGDQSCASHGLRLLTMEHLERLIRICDEGNWNGSADDKETARRIAESSLNDMRNTVLNYSDSIDLKKWFPCMV